MHKGAGSDDGAAAILEQQRTQSNSDLKVAAIFFLMSQSIGDLKATATTEHWRSQTTATTEQQRLFLMSVI